MIWLVVAVVASGATWSGGDYGGANVTVADGDVLDGELLNVGVFTVPAGVRVTVSPQVPLVVEATSIVIEGHLDGNGAGEPPAFWLDGLGPGGGGFDNQGGGGGGGYGGSGGMGDDTFDAACAYMPGGAPGATYGSHDDPFDAPLGSSGATSIASGGAGGGSVTLRGDTITVAASGSVTVDGGDALDPNCVLCEDAGSGGGSGGSLILDGLTVTVDGVLSAAGGDGGDGDAGYCHAGGGGGGGGGRIKVYGTYSGSGILNHHQVAGGVGGSTKGEPGVGRKGGFGTIYVDDLVAGPPALAVSGACGGSVTMDVTGATPNGRIAILTGTGVGADALASGTCAGVVTGLADLAELGVRPVDELGERHVTSDVVTAAACGAPIQVVDLWSCTVSPVVNLP